MSLFRSIRCLVVLPILISSALADGRPVRGSAQWSVLLCKFSDAGAPPHDLTYYQNMVLTRGAGGLADYWNDVSGGLLSMDGSSVHGWYTLSLTKSQAQSQWTGDHRTDGIGACKSAAQSSSNDPYTPPSGNRVAVITYPDVDMYGGNGFAFLPYSVDVGGIAHESGHGISLNHSFSDDPSFRDADWAAIGEYDDPWDVMSWANAFRVATPFGDGPPGLNGYHLDRMGWVPRSRIVTFGASGARSGTVTLAALYHPEASGPLLVRVPFDPSDLNHYYTIEFRKQDAWNGGIPSSVVMIHEVKRRDDNVYYSFLLRERTGDRNPVQSLSANGVSINLVSVSANTNQASVSISTAATDRCVQGYVWREANPSDHVCVPPSTRSQTAADNAAGPGHRAGGGAFGADTCVQGFVWRDAFPGDHVCVVPATRSQAAADNAAAQSRGNFTRLVYGPNTCKQGYVWREADDRDWVCVSPATRSQTAADNAAGPSHRAGGGAFGPDTCVQGFVWRDAFPGDHVCVVPATRSQAAGDDAAANGRLEFN